MTAERIAPPGSTYAEQRHYAVPARLTDLRGPAAGVIVLDQRIDWSGDGRYNLDDPGDLQVLYQTVLNQAATADELCRWLDEATLRRVWHDLWLPGRLRALWHARFPELGAPPTALAS
ncbi:hypothetical protein GCM10010399_67860 [Dactylosporangium fulvum]|uniref:Uncharacterized protein n=1 Tax=Dactylosporangium fulvum TaxID=53359 RepID=A0ABY5W148_9ACTN|nr:hypothetical protein [Dactylosporangium fulvum]UWP82831.1 hypothetical protein Dfulv_00475 [Dactylosporangium fulvum]